MASVACTKLSSSHFFDLLSRRQPGVLVIDYESTIAKLGRADCVFPYPTIQELLDRIAMAGTRIILVTNRPAEELRRHFVPPGPEIWTEAAAALQSVTSSAPLALIGGAGARGGQRVQVCPVYRAGKATETSSAAEDMVQFLMDWMRACTREVD